MGHVSTGDDIKKFNHLAHMGTALWLCGKMGLPMKYVNLALRGTSSQSSTYNHLGAAKNAIDGSSSADYMSGHCTHTAQDASPWWRLDLTKVYNVTRVKVTNRGDCCSERIDGAEIRIGSSPEHGGIKNPNLGEEAEYVCGMVGQYVTVTIPDRPEYLTLCEVKVYGNFFYAGVNLALRGTSSQSSTYNELGAAENAIDGSSSANYMSKHCSHTAQDAPPWWRLDLTKVYNVQRVKVTNREDCCSERINGAEIRIGLSPEHGGTKNPKCAEITSLGLGEEAEYVCNMVGQYVTVTILDRREYLTLCEVKVYGEEASEKPPTSNVAPLYNAYQSSVQGEGDARKAIDGYLNNDAAGDQCAKTKEEPDPWWKLDLNSDHKILSIAVTSRGECCDAPIKGAEIRVGNSNTSWKENPVCGTISSMDPGQTVSFYCNGMVGRFVYIVIPDDTRSLSLCEVQVFGVPTDKPSKFKA
uniref:Fucolectin tachylectin-4 pentraxin-1 domain-containing protein n=1 Tax=Leptobrachium leishanense TaxID=445787 RepID=A0A8C5QVD4_9ANUR